MAKQQGPIVNQRRGESRIPFWRRLQWDLALTFVILVLISVGIVMGFAFARMGQQVQRQLAQHLGSVAELKLGQIGRWLDNAQSHLVTFMAVPQREIRLAVFAGMPPARDQDYVREQSQINDLMRGFVENQETFQELLVHDVSGRIVGASQPDLVGRRVSDQPYFEASLTEDRIQPPYYSPAHGKTVMVLTYRLIDRGSSRVTGVVVGGLNLDALGSLMADQAGPGETGETYLVSRQGNYLITPSRYAEQGYIQTRSYRSLGIDRALGGQDGADVYPSYRAGAEPVIGVYRWIPALDAALMAEQEQAEGLRGIRRARNAAWLLTGIVIVAVALIGFGVAARVARPVVAITRVAAQIASGDLDQRIQIRRRDEIGQLADVFNAMADQLGESINTLERRVAERTHDLERRARYLSISAQVVREAALVTDSSLLLERLVGLISERFGFYHVGVFVLDDNEEWAVLIAASSIGGQRMVARGHRLRVGLQGIVGTAAGRGESLVVQNVSEDAVYLTSPDLPETRSEMALPLRTRGKVLGVLDVQSKTARAFAEDDVEVLQTLADQVAIALSNARLIERTRAALDAERRAYAEASREAWSAMLRSTPVLGYRYDHTGVVRLAENEYSDEEDVLAGPTQEATRVTLPVTVRDISVGSITAQKPADAGQWTKEERALLDVLVRQVSVALDSAQLYQTAQRREVRERVTRQIADDIRAATDIEQILQVATQALGRQLDTSEVVIRLGTESSLHATSAGSGI